MQGKDVQDDQKDRQSNDTPTDKTNRVRKKATTVRESQAGW